MFGLIEEMLYGEKIEKSSGKCHKLFSIDGKLVCVENFKKILSVSESEVKIKLYQGELSIFGENLSVKEIGISSIKIVGKITKIENNV